MKKHLTNKSNRRGKRRHGFLRRMSRKSGQQVLQRRRKKGRRRLIPS